jgi:preprotein translocase subunit SecY
VTPDQLNRVWFTLGALLVYRIGSYIPLPGIDVADWQRIFATHVGGILGTFDMYAGGAIQRLAIFALGITPYVSAAIIMQIAAMVAPGLRRLGHAGERGRRTFVLYTRYLTLVLAAVQAYGIAIGLEDVGGVVGEPGSFFRLSTVVTLTGGTMFLVWLADQITGRGIGNGLSLLLFAGIMVELPAMVAAILDLGRQGVLSSVAILGQLMMTIVATALIVFMERARRWLLIEYSAREVGGRTLDGRQSPLPLKLNMAGLIPALFASWLIGLLVAIANFNNRPVMFFLYFGLIVLFAFLYARFVFNPADAAQNLQRHGGFIPGIAPGEPTAQRIDHVVTRITTIGSVYLAVVCLMPVAFTAYMAVPFHVGGTSLLIVVCTAMDIEEQIEAERSI